MYGTQYGIVTSILQALGFDLRASSFMAFLPWLVMAVGSSLSGVLADSLVARGVHVTLVRKALQTVAFLVPALALVALSQPGLSPKVGGRVCLAEFLWQVGEGVLSLGGGCVVPGHYLVAAQQTQPVQAA